MTYEQELENMTPEQARARLKSLLLPGRRLYITDNIPAKKRGYTPHDFRLIVDVEQVINDQKIIVPELKRVNDLVILSLMGTDGASCLAKNRTPDDIRIHEDASLYRLMGELSKALEHTFPWGWML